jgi:SPOR domain/PilZ domain
MENDRRQHPRLGINSPVLVSLGVFPVGLLFDLGEGGLSVRGLAPQRQNEFHFVSFRLPSGSPGGDCFIEASAEIAWRRNSEKRLGLRFVELADRSQRELRDWIGIRSGTIAPGPLDLETACPELCFSGDSSDLPYPSISRQYVVSPEIHQESELAKSREGGSTPLNESRRQLELFLLAAFLCSPFVLLGYYLPSLLEKSKLRRIKAESRMPQLTSNRAITPVDLSSAKQSTLPSRLSVDQPGFVLQVGAMRYEENADALAATLNQMNFPAFVFRRQGDRFYRVAVGPFETVESSIKVKDDLERKEFQAILKPWSPS